MIKNLQRNILVALPSFQLVGCATQTTYEGMIAPGEEEARGTTKEKGIDASGVPAGLFLLRPSGWPFLLSTAALVTGALAIGTGGLGVTAPLGETDIPKDCDDEERCQAEKG